MGDREGLDVKFVSVRVNEEMPLFFVSTDNVMSQRPAFVLGS
jgi:hypothetical protein